MKAMQMAVQGFDVPSFARYSANKVVELYELCDKAEKKSDFWIKMSTGHKLFDDVKTEREASNYGKVNVFKDVFEKRYESKAMTYITCNYQEDAPNDVEKAVNEFGAKYGARVWDRMYEMFNIIEFKGKSFRK
jgi:DNA replication protein DnaC